MWNAGLDDSQAGIKIGRRNNNDLRNADDTILMAESKEELKSLLMKVKEESEKVVLKGLWTTKPISRFVHCYFLQRRHQGKGVFQAIICNNIFN